MRSATLAALTISLFLSRPAACAGVDVAELAAEYASPALGPVHTVSNVAIRISNMSFDLTAGSVAPVLAGDQQIGIFFSGEGTFSYRSTDRVEQSVVQFEAKRLDRTHEKNKDGSMTVSGSFEHLYLRVNGIDLPAAAAATQAAPQTLGEAFREHRRRFRNARWTPPSHLLLRARFDEPSAKVAVAELSGRDNHAYVLDTVESKRETLYALITLKGLFNIPELRGALFPFVIAEQPVDHPRTAFVQPRYLLAGVDYTLVAGEGAAASLSVMETIVPRNAAQSLFRFDLLSGRWDEDKYRPLRLDGVFDEAGKPLSYHYEDDSVLVALPAKAPPDEPVTIRFEISGDILFRPGNGSYWHLGTTPWFPRPGYNGQYYMIHSIVKVRKPWVAFASGDTVSRKEEGEYNVFENASEKPLQFAVVQAGKYTIAEEKFEGLTIRVAPYAGINDTHVKQLARLAYKIIKFYEPWLGPFPFKEFNIIEVNDYGWGQAPPGMMFITREAFNPLINAESRYYSKGVNQRFAHEIAHQYWGIVVKMGSDEEQWFTESFAEFCSALVVKEIEGQKGYDAMVIGWRVGAKDAGEIAPIILANRIAIPGDPEKEGEYRRNLIYNKGAFALAVLRKQAGDPKFFSWLRNLQGQFAWRFMTTTDAAKLLQRIDGGKDYLPFFEKYIWGTEMPQMPR